MITPDGISFDSSTPFQAAQKDAEFMNKYMS